MAGNMNPTTTDMDTTDDLNIMRQEVIINIPIISENRPPLPPPPPPPQTRRRARRRPQPLIVPRADLLVDYNSLGVPLYKASISGDWPAANAILDKHPELVRSAITENLETALHIAVSAEGTKLMEDFVQNLVKKMKAEDLELQNRNSNTALCFAAAAGSVKIAEIMVNKNKEVLNIPGSQGAMPLYLAVLYGKHDMVWYLYRNSNRMTGDFWTDENRGLVVMKCVEADFFDVALRIVTDSSELASKQAVLRDVLLAFARKPDVFNGIEGNIISRIINSFFAIIHLKSGLAEKNGEALQLLRIFLGNTMRRPKANIDGILKGPPGPLNEYGEQQYPSRILFLAAEMGNTIFIVEHIRAYPDLIWNKNDDGLTIFHIAVMHRHQGIYNLLYEIGLMRDLITPLTDKDGNNMLHLVGKTSVKVRPRTSGASLLMQRELLWFKEVEKIMPLSYRERKNKDGQTPYKLFSENNKDLVSQGLNWMKDCMVVATLIVTVAFAVAFTVPGGYNQDNGIPMFIRERTFIVFVIADAISLFSSSASLLVFLSILTSRHGERDFMISLPRKLMIGLATLFISVTAMMVTFSASFFVLYRNGLQWVPILISAFAAMPVILFAILQFPLLVDMFRSIYDSTYLFKPKKRMLYI